MFARHKDGSDDGFEWVGMEESQEEAEVRALEHLIGCEESFLGASAKYKRWMKVIGIMVIAAVGVWVWFRTS